MRQWFLYLFLLSCSIETQIEMIRPGAPYNIKRGDYEGIEWLDEKQSKPTIEEMDAALLECQRAISSPTLEQEQAKTDLMDTRKSDAERIDAMIKYLGI